jgi:hypothetical protein
VTIAGDNYASLFDYPLTVVILQQQRWHAQCHRYLASPFRLVQVAADIARLPELLGHKE